jgi:hypothetical protein
MEVASDEMKHDALRRKEAGLTERKSTGHPFAPNSFVTVFCFK